MNTSPHFSMWVMLAGFIVALTWIVANVGAVKGVSPGEIGRLAVATLISGSLLTRSSPNDQTFLFQNSGGTLDIVVHEGLTGDALKVQCRSEKQITVHFMG